MSDYDPKSLMNLDVCVINALELFAEPNTNFPKVDFDRFTRPLVVGSGNAAATGRIIFADKDAVFADESTYVDKLESVPAINGVVLISASGGKHAPTIAQTAKKRGLKVMLLTCNPKSSAGADVDEVHVFPSRAEPYTYNTSTYMAMILAKTAKQPHHEAKQILEYIKKAVDPALAGYERTFAESKAFFLLVPEQFELIRVMLITKFVELFGRRIARDVFTSEQAKHATTVIETNKEVFIVFGHPNTMFGQERLNIPLPIDAGYAAMIAVGYYVIGKIQVHKPQWFKKSIGKYCNETAKVIWGRTLPSVVEYP